MYRSALETPVSLQWDPDSRYPLPDPGSAAWNCGPSVVTNIADFYRDRSHSIYAVRRLAVSYAYTATSITDQKIMLDKLGVPGVIGRFSLATIKKTIASGRQPMLIGLLMSQVPLNVAGHPFRGWHAVEALQNAVYSGVSGILIRDPNFNRTFRTDPTGGKRFYPDWVIQAAFVNTNGWGWMPTKAKVLASTPVPSSDLADGDPYPMRYRTLVNQDTGALPKRFVRAGKPVRKGPATSSATYATVKADTIFLPFGYIPRGDLPSAEQKYGDVYLGNWYHVNGDHVGYVKAVDLK